MSALRIAFAGTPAFAVHALEALNASSNRIVGVLTQPDRPSGRGRKLTASPVKVAAQARGLAVAQPATMKGDAGVAILREWQPDALVVVAYGIILPTPVLELPRLGCINIHASLLPRWRGAAPIQRAILEGDEETGVTIMQMDAGLDTGPMLLARRVPIGIHDTSATLHDTLGKLGAAAVIEALSQLSGGHLKPQAQPAEGATYARKIEKAEALIDWTRSAEQIDRQVRAFNPWPIAETRYSGEPLRIYSAGIDSMPNRPEKPPIVSPAEQSGVVLGVSPNGIRVRCGRGVLALKSVQRPGRRPVSAAEFARGEDIVGRQLG